MYDFALQPGESAVIGAYAFSDEFPTYTVTCEARQPSEDYPGMEEMVMKRTGFPFEEGDYEYWLVGIGRTTGPYWNRHYASYASGMYDQLTSVDLLGDTICTRKKAGINDIESNAQAEPMAWFDLQGRPLTAPVVGRICIVRMSDGSVCKIIP